METVGSRWRSARTTVALDSWSYLAEDLVRIHATWREREDFEEKRGDFVSLYAKVREEILLQSSRESFFHAGRVCFQTGGMVTLTYDFRTAEELLDFHPVGAIKNILERDKSKNSVRLRGEYRILIGEPFEGFLRISGTAEALAENAPNLNFALWTHEGDAVTFPDRDQIDLAKRTRGETGVGDYFVVAHGYRLLGTLSAARRRRIRFDRNRLPLHFSQPSFAIISGYRDSTLHRNVYSEVIWERPLGDRFRSTIRFDVAMEGGELKWTVNRAKPLFGADKKLDRLKENAPYSGSVTVFTNGSEVVFSKIELRGKTRPEWFRLRARARAEEDAKRLGE